MKSFSEFVNEQSLYGGYLINRGSMPQVNDTNAFKKYLRKSGVDFQQIDLDPNELKASQTEYDEVKVNAIFKNIGQGYNPIIVASDNQVIDGHHRILAHQKANQQVKSILVDLDSNKLLRMLIDDA